MKNDSLLPLALENHALILMTIMGHLLPGEARSENGEVHGSMFLRVVMVCYQ